MKKIATFFLWTGLVFVAVSAEKISYTYDYPEQLGRSRVVKSDPQNSHLSDGKIQTGAVTQGALRELLIDVMPEAQKNISAVELTFSPDVKTAPYRIHFYLPQKDGSFSTIPEIILTNRTPGNFIQLDLPWGIRASKFRLGLVPMNHKIEIQELAFLNGTAKAKNKALVSNEAGKDLMSIPLSPAEVAAIDYHPSPVIGVNGHILHTRDFFPKKYNLNWTQGYTIDSLLAAGFGWVREPLYTTFFAGPEKRICHWNSRSAAQNRQQYEAALSVYDRLGVKVLLCVMYSQWENPLQIKQFHQWFLEMVPRHPSIQAIELENEPNTRSDKKPQDYVTLLKKVCPILKKGLPTTPLYIGALLGWGVNFPRKYEKFPSLPLAVEWFEEVLKAGVLEFADGVSFHPYRSFPESARYDTLPLLEPDAMEKEFDYFLQLVRKYTPAGKTMNYLVTEYGNSARGVDILSRLADRNPEESRQLQADWASRYTLLMLNRILNGDSIKAIFWYDLKCDDVDVHESHFGLVSENNLVRYPAYGVFQRICRNYGNPADYRPAKFALQSSLHDSALGQVVWVRKRDEAVIAGFWRKEQYQQFDQDFSTVLTLSLPENRQVKSVTLDHLRESEARRIGFRQIGNRVEVHVTVMRRAGILQIQFEN